MHAYYRRKAGKLKQEMNALLGPVVQELSQLSGISYRELLEKIWKHYEENMLENFPYIGGDTVSGTKKLTGAYCFVSMGEVLKPYGVSLEESGRLMVLAYERRFTGLPDIAKKAIHKLFTNVRLLN